MISVLEQYLLYISLPLYAGIIIFEILLSNWQVKRFYSWKETAMNFYFTFANAGIDLLFRGVYLVALIFCYEHSIVSLPSTTFMYWLLLFVLEDLAFYTEHRVDHSSRFFWAVHVTHHSSEEFNLTTGLRSSVFQPLYRFIYFLPIAFLGFNPMDILFMFSITQVYGVLVHTQYIKNMPAWFEAVFVSPSHHRVHHASNVRYLDKNLGMVLIIWDKLFGTYQPEMREDPVRFGITKPPAQPYHPVNSITHEFQNIRWDVRKVKSWNQKLAYIFMPPGWSHDGSSKTSRELQDELALQLRFEKDMHEIFHKPVQQEVKEL